MTITLDDIVSQNNVILSARADKEVLAMHEESGMCFSFAGSGAHIWEAAATPVSVRHICASLQERYSVDEEVCARETMAYIAMLIDEGLLTVAPPGTT